MPYLMSAPSFTDGDLNNVGRVRPWLDLEGADNVRDLGGLPVTDGGRTRYGVLLRSGTLQDLTEADVAHLIQDFGLRSVVDLRLHDEAAREGSALRAVPGVNHHPLPLWSADPVRADAVAHTGMDVVDHYVAFLEGGCESIVAAARLFAAPGSLPAVFHCAAGKDRTGVLAAVVLDAVGVTAEAIVDEYALTEQRIEAIRARLARLETYRRMRAVAQARDARGRGSMSANEDTMRRFLHHLRATYGGGAGYLAAHGFTAVELAALKRALVEDAPA
jgi:protein tyrosine/serine phosphatase